MSENASRAGERVAEDELVEAYERATAGLRHAMALGEIAQGFGNPRRAADHLVGALLDLAPELRLLSHGRLG